MYVTGRGQYTVTLLKAEIDSQKRWYKSTQLALIKYIHVDPSIGHGYIRSMFVLSITESMCAGANAAGGIYSSQRNISIYMFMQPAAHWPGPSTVNLARPKHGPARSPSCPG